MMSFSVDTGAVVSGAAHVRQSIADILRTPLGSRVLRRDYGSALFALLDTPASAVLQVDLIQATAAALTRWEPRVIVEQIRVSLGAPGQVLIDLDIRYRATGAGETLTGLTV